MHTSAYACFECVRAQDGGEHREKLVAAEAKVVLLEEHVAEMAVKEVGTRRVHAEREQEIDRLKCRVEELQVLALVVSCYVEKVVTRSFRVHATAPHRAGD